MLPTPVARRGLASTHGDRAACGAGVKFGIRTPSLKKRIAARTSWKRYVRHNLGFKAPRGWGWLTNPKRAAYNRVYNRTSVSVDRLFKTGRRRGSARHDGAALVLVLGLIVAAAFGVYLLIAGAVVFVGWLVRVATKKPATASVAAEATIPPTPPSAEYCALVPVEPAVFEDPEQVRGAAHAVLAAWLQQLPKAPRRVADLVRCVSTRTRLIGRLTTELDGRRFVWRTAPIGGRQTIGAPPLNLEALDPWNPPADLRTASRYVTACWTCCGDGRVACGSCSGGGRVTCADCAGAGKYYGTTANGAHRLLNCKGCRGKGTVKCGACSRGVVDCATCRKAKKLECWLEIDESSRQDVQVEPDGEVTKAFVWGQDGVLATREQIELDARVVDVATADRVLHEHQLPSSVPVEWRREYWPRIRAQIQPGERVRAQTFMLLEVPSTVITYAVLGEQQTIELEGRRMLAPPASSDVLFARRATILGRSKVVLAALPLGALATYLARGSYFVSDRVAPLLAGIVGATAAVAICAYAVLWCATLGRRAAVKWALGAIAPLGAATALVLMAEPSLSRARSYVASGELGLARVELDALGSASDPALAGPWADIALHDALEAPSCSAALDSAQQIPEAMPQHATAVAHADALAFAAARASLQSGDLEEADWALDCASAPTRESARAVRLRGDIALAAGRRCIEARRWDCGISKLNEAEQLGAAEARELVSQARSTIQADVDASITAARAERDLERRLQLETAALALWTSYLATTTASKPANITQLEKAAARDEQLVARQRAIERKRAEQLAARLRAEEERAEKRRLAAEERERRRAAAAERRRMYSSLVCNDGSLSPSCVCGGSWRGCCSHHGGVAGCQGD